VAIIAVTATSLAFARINDNDKDVLITPASPGPSPAHSVLAPPKQPPSQSAADARRDGVLPAVAALPLSKRVHVIQRVPTTQGMWVVSRMPANNQQALGRTSGVYGRDFIATDEYGEILLMDAAGRRIIRAYPLPSVPPQSLLVRSDAVYCARQGDGGLPTSMLCRIDRSTLQAKVRLFPSTFDYTPGALQPPNFYTPPNWTVDGATNSAIFERVVASGNKLYTEGQDGRAQIDPNTLNVIGRLSKN
jgi:hypothetical protein